MITPPDLFDTLMTRGYVPTDEGNHFDLLAGDLRMVRVATDDGLIAVHGLEHWGVCWTVTLTAETPWQFMAATLDEAARWAFAKVTCDLINAPAHQGRHTPLANCRHAAIPRSA